MPRLVIDVIEVSQSVNAKVNQRHGLTVLEVEEAVEEALRRRSSTSMSPNEDGVLRLLLVGETEAGRKINVVLYPTPTAGTWNLATAFPVH